MRVWLNTSEINKLSMYGGYDYKGDTVEVTGTFHRDCGEHEGDIDIHSDLIKVMSERVAIPRVIEMHRIKK